MSVSVVRPLLDDLWKSEEAQAERAAKGEDVAGVSIGEILGTWWIDWPLPFWAKWVRWQPGEGELLEPQIGGMAVVNNCYAERFDKDVQTYIRHDDHLMWQASVADGYGLADISSVYREAGPEFWDRIGPGWWGPRYWEHLGNEPGAGQVDSVKSVARDRSGVIRFCTGMVVNEQPGWRPDSGARGASQRLNGPGPARPNQGAPRAGASDSRSGEARQPRPGNGAGNISPLWGNRPVRQMAEGGRR